MDVHLRLSPAQAARLLYDVEDSFLVYRTALDHPERHSATELERAERDCGIFAAIAHDLREQGVEPEPPLGTD